MSVDFPEPLMILQPEELRGLMQAADYYRERGQFSEMEGVLKGLRHLEPDNPMVFSLLGYACHQQQKWDDAEQHYRRAEELAGGYEPTASANLVAVCMATGRVDDALAQLERVVGSGDTSPETARVIAIVKAYVEAQDPPPDPH